MSLSLTVHCDVSWTFGTCGRFLPTGTADPTEATAYVTRQGWEIRGTGADRCPGHAHRPNLISPLARIHHTTTEVTS
ncbi:hypothetical protein [Streptomyces anulatus]|uniref:hypothetical protein n=1 Tax=Streptomyces anulatus TaxID=1892 RepID=UPI00368C2D08